jgi:multidrug resistance protein, MATE family
LAPLSPFKPGGLCGVLVLFRIRFQLRTTWLALSVLRTHCPVFCPQIALLWWYAEPVLLLAQQPADVAAMAARYTRRSIPGLVGFGVFEATRRFLQVQGIVMPMLYVSVVVNALHPLMNWLFISKLGWGFDGAPWATVASQTLMASLLLVYLRVRCVHVPGTWTGFSKDGVKGLGEYLKLGVPGGLKVVWMYLVTCSVGLLSGMVVV